MAEEPKVLIFPSIRISDLKREATLHKERFEKSSSELKATVIENANPLTYVKKNLPKVFGIATSIAAAGTLLGHMRGKSSKLKKEEQPVKSGTGFTRNLLAWTTALALRTAAPLVLNLVRNALANAFHERSEKD